jgi:hypothetical protein
LAGGHRFTAFLQGDGRSAPLPAATALFNAWRAMQVECVGDDPAAGTPDKGPLSSPAALAGADTSRNESLQHLLSDQLETVREKALDRELKALPTLTIEPIFGFSWSRRPLMCAPLPSPLGRPTCTRLSRCRRRIRARARRARR